jgi:hypothetical protein
MIFTVDTRATEVLLRLDKGYKRMLFTTVHAINDTAKQVQQAEQQQVRRVFTVRKPGFLERQVKYFGASFNASTGVGKWEARVGVGIGRQLSGSPLLLPRFEHGGIRGGVKGGGVAVPVVGGARPGKAALVPDSLFIQRLQLRRTTRGRPRKNARPAKAGTIVRKGLLGTFQIPNVGILQRLGTGIATVLYAFKPTVRIPPTLQFYRTAERVLESNFARNVQARINEAFARHG